MNLLAWIFSRNVVSQASKLRKSKPKRRWKARSDGSPDCEHNEYEILESRRFWESDGTAGHSWGITRCRVCGARGSWNTL